MADGTRVVLVKPGDVLIFGNVGSIGPDEIEKLPNLRDALGLRAVLVFEDDIDLAAVPSALLDNGL